MTRPTLTPRRLRAYSTTIAVAAIALLTGAPLAAQIISIPLGVSRPERPSPNATLLGAPADIAGAVAATGRRPASRYLDEVNHPEEVLTFLGLSRGVRVLVVEHDLGYFGEIIGGAVAPGGRVTELVPPAAMADPAARAALSDAIGRAPNLSPLPATAATARLAPGGLDFVLLYSADDRLSSATAPDERRTDLAAFIGKLFTAVRPGGIVGVVDDVAPIDAGASPGRTAANVRQDFARAGFVLDNSGQIRGDETSDQPADPDAVTQPPRTILKFRKPE